MWLWRPRSPTICCLQAGSLRKQVVQFQYKAEGLRTRRANGISPNLSPRVWNQEDLCTRTEENGYLSSSKRENSPFFHLFVPLRPSANYMLSTHIGRCDLFNQLIQTLNSSGNTLTGTPRNKFYQLSGPSLAQSGWQINQLSHVGKMFFSLSHFSLFIAGFS